MSRSRHKRTKYKKVDPIQANMNNLREINQRKLIPNLKFREVPVIEIDVKDVTTSNFIETVSEYSKLPNVVQSGGFLVLRPKESQKYQYLIDPQTIKHFDARKHSDKHYFISNDQKNSYVDTPLNTEWIHDVPQLSKTIDGKALLVESYPQKTCDVLTPLFEHFNEYKTEIPKKYNHRKRKRQELEIDKQQRSKKRKLTSLPKQLSVPKQECSFDLTQHFSSDDMRNESHSDSEHYKDHIVLSTNVYSTTQTQKLFDLDKWNKILSKTPKLPRITLSDMAIKGNILPLPSLDSPELVSSASSPQIESNGPKREENHSKDIQIEDNRQNDAKISIDPEKLRGFAFVVNQFEETKIKIDKLWTCDEFESTLLHSPYDNISAEDIPSIFASEIIKGTETYYGIIGGDITLYDESSPLDLVNLSLFGPFAEFIEGGDDNEFMEGIHSPYIYLGNASTWFAWHREDMNLYAVNHLLWGSDKIWYCVEPNDYGKVMEYVRLQYTEYCGECGDVNSCRTPLQHKQFWFDPYILLSMGINVSFHRQKVGDIMITPPGGLHCGLNAGPNMAQSLNFMVYDAQCWKLCLSAMHSALFNECNLCLNSVWIDFHKLAERCRKSKKCDGKIEAMAPNKSIVPCLEYDDDESNKDFKNLCIRLNEQERKKKQCVDPIRQMQGERAWVYPIRGKLDKYWYPAIYTGICSYSWDSLHFELLYQFKYLDSGTVKGRNETMFFGEDNVLWSKGICILDWNRKQTFAILTKKDKAACNGFISAKQYSYPRKRGNMLLNYKNVNEGNWKNMYWQKCVYYELFEEERKYKDLYKRKKQNFRSYQQMKSDIDKHHHYFMRSVVMTTDESENTLNEGDEDYCPY